MPTDILKYCLALKFGEFSLLTGRREVVPVTALVLFSETEGQDDSRALCCDDAMRHFTG